MPAINKSGLAPVWRGDCGTYATLFALLLAGSAAAQQTATDETELTGIAGDLQQPAMDSVDDPGAVDDDGLQEIVIDDQRVVDDDPYLDEGPIEDRILDTGPMPETDEQQLRRMFVLYMDAVSDKMFEEADSLAKQIVELTIRLHGLDSHESAKALTNLAIAQHGIDDFESAILNYEAAVGIIERVEDRLDSALVNPLRGLGAAQLAAGRPDLARSSFDRAIHVSHVNDGPHNLDQIESLQSLAETYLAVGEFSDAIDVQKRIYYLQARNVDAKSTDIIPALRTQARWQQRMQRYDEQRYTLRRIISVIESNHGKQSLDLIVPLTELGNSYLYVGFGDAPIAQPVSVSSGEVYLKRAVRIAEANKDASWQLLTNAMLKLGDYYVLTERPNRGHRVYRDTWRILSEDADEARLAGRAEKLESAVLLQSINPPKLYGVDQKVPSNADLPGFSTGTAVYRYSVSTRGRATNVRLVEADPPGLDDMYEAVGRQLRRIIHRPRHADGSPVQTDDVTFTHSFYYKPDDVPQPEDDSDNSETAAPD